MAEPKRAKMTIPEFLRWQELQEDRYELVDGEQVPHRMMIGASQRHDAITLNVLALLHGQLRGGTCRPTTADVAIRIPGGGLRRPGAAVDCGPLRDSDYTASEPVLVVEVLSPSTRQIDRFRKLEEYKSVASIRHILLVEPSVPAVVLYSRGDEDRWTSSDVIGRDAAVRIADLDLSLPMRELYEGLSFEASKVAHGGA
jgi:Uma2 family endonuclease